MDGLIGYLNQISNLVVKPAVRIPLTASSWLGVKTNASSGNFDRFPNLGDQYQIMITKMVEQITEAGAVAILDLHWSNDDTE